MVDHDRGYTELPEWVDPDGTETLCVHPAVVVKPGDSVGARGCVDYDE